MKFWQRQHPGKLAFHLSDRTLRRVELLRSIALRLKLVRIGRAHPRKDLVRTCGSSA